jgi:hypothetical protein
MKYLFLLVKIIAAALISLFTISVLLYEEYLQGFSLILIIILMFHWPKDLFKKSGPTVVRSL